ncbi:MAG: hypothetical protein ACD_46C00164G0001 [uncultured bacterium]|nr:MAG: hypothetical protein ACD_46C00164G0001 [uncultured bacterium]
MHHKVKLDIEYPVSRISLKIKNVFETNDTFICISEISYADKTTQKKSLTDWVEIINGDEKSKPVKHYVFIPDDMQEKELKDVLQKHNIKIIFSKDDIDELRGYNHLKLTKSDLLSGVKNNMPQERKSFFHKNKTNHILYAKYLPPLSLLPSPSLLTHKQNPKPLVYDQENEVFYREKLPHP